jgi:hypothetical protein
MWALRTSVKRPDVSQLKLVILVDPKPPLPCSENAFHVSIELSQAQIDDPKRWRETIDLACRLIRERFISPRTDRAAA